MPFPLASPSEGSYREPAYQARIDLYARNHFTPAEYQKIVSRGITFCRGDADTIRHAFIGEEDIKHKVQKFTGSAYVYDLAHALLLQIKRTVQQLVNVPEGLDIKTLMSVLFNLRGYKMIETTAPNAQGVLGADRGDGKAEVQLRALSTTDFKTMANQGYIQQDGRYFRPIRVPVPGSPADTYPWSLTAFNTVAADCVVAQMIEICRDRNITPAYFSVAQRAGVFVPLELDAPAGGDSQGAMGMRQGAGMYGAQVADQTLGYERMMGTLPQGLNNDFRMGGGTPSQT